MPKLTKRHILDARQARYRRRMDLRITTPAEAKAFVDDVGFCFLFPIQGVETPGSGNCTQHAPADCSRTGFLQLL